MTARSRLIPGLALLALVVIVVARSWLSDDAFITLRTVDNLVHGFGARWNVADRVQTFTHPLWMIVVAIPYAVTREPYFTTLALNWILTTIACAVLAFRISVSAASAFLILTVLALSAAFTDYATSGLENALTHALLAVFLLVVLARREGNASVLPATLLASFVALARPDAFVLIAPPLALIVLSARAAKPWGRFVLGLAPLIAWGAFSFAYYGFPWPNTAYAKLGSGIPAIESAVQGLRYLFESLRHDPLTLTAIAAGVFVAMRRRDRMERALAAGVVLYLVWVVKIGGDFMSGRFLTAPLFVAAAILVRGRFGSPRLVSGMVAATIVVGSFASRAATWNVGVLDLAKEHAVDEHGIADERAFYLPTTGICLRLGPDGGFKSNAISAALAAKAAGPAVVRLTDRGCGMYGYFAGPSIHVVDEWALGDSLLARLPAARNLHWRIGHFTRAIPDGYLETLRSGSNRLRDAELARYWDRLSLVVRGPVFSRERWKAILEFALGRPAPSSDPDRWRLPDLVEVDAAAAVPATGLAFGDSGIDLKFDPPSRAVHVALGLRGGTEFSVDWRRGTRVLASTRILSPAFAAEVPGVARGGFDRMRVLPLRGDGSYRVTTVRPTD